MDLEPFVGVSMDLPDGQGKVHWHLHVELNHDAPTEGGGTAATANAVLGALTSEGAQRAWTELQSKLLAMASSTSSQE